MLAKFAEWANRTGEKSFHLHRINIGPRLALCFLFIILAMLVGNAVLLRQFHSARVQAESLSGVDQELIAVLQAHISLMSFYERLDFLARSEDTSRLVREAEELRNALLEESRRSRNAIRNLPPQVKPDPALFPNLVAIQEALPAQLDAITVLAKLKDWEAVRLRLVNQVRPLESRSSELVASIDREVGKEQAKVGSNIERAQRQILLIVPATGLLTLLFASFLGWAITRSITQPLGRLMAGTTALAVGDFNHRVPTVGNDEIARLGSIFNGMIVRRKRAEEELQQLVDLVPQLILVLEPDGKWLHANRIAREYTGLTPDEYRSVDVVGKVIHPDDVENMRVVCERGLSAADPFEIDARLLGKDGVHRWFLFRYNPLVEEGCVRRWYATATEIESRKQEEDRVRKENVRLEERTRIAQELHDTLLQTFLSASMQLSVVLDGVPPDARLKPRLDRILQIMNQGIEEGRNTIERLRASDFRTLDLAVALSTVQQELAIQPDIDFRVIVGGRQQPLRLPIQHEIYRIGREALVNAFRHSSAKHVEFELEYADTHLCMRVRDNGCGIDPQVLHSGRERHWGLAGMRERATRIGGLLKISSSAISGTEIQLFIPGSIAFQASPLDPNS